MSIWKHLPSFSAWIAEDRDRARNESYINYKLYIASDEWKEKAEDAKRRAWYRCQVCNASRDSAVLHAHHRTYERLGHEDPDDITVLCSDCHFLFEKHRKMKRFQEGIWN